MSHSGPDAAMLGRGSTGECRPANKQGKPVAYIAQEWAFGPSQLFTVDQFGLLFVPMSHAS